MHTSSRYAGSGSRAGDRLYALHLLFLFCFFWLAANAQATDWTGPAQQLARKIVAVTGPGAVAVTVENRSSLAKKDNDYIGNILQMDMEQLGARPAAPEQAAASVVVSLSENPLSYVWVAQIRQGARDAVVVMVSVPRGDEPAVGRDDMPLTLHKTPLWTQEDRILDIAVLEEDNSPRHIAVLDGEKVSIYRQKNGKWQQEQSLSIAHTRPWPRDLRGRVIAAKDHLLDVYLPGVFCRSTNSSPLALNCRESDDPWPLATALPALSGFYAPSRNFFTGALSPGVGKLTTIGKFYSAAALPRGSYALWLFAGSDEQTHLVDGVTDQAQNLKWGSEIVSLKAPCRTSWQVLATGQGGSGGDSVRAYEIADREPLPVMHR